MVKKTVTIEDVKNFWESNPLFSRESKFEVGSKEFFEEHRKVCLEDVFVGKLEEELFIPKDLPKNADILDLGCGIGFWAIEFLMRNPSVNLHTADLTQKGLELTKQRLDLYGLKANLSIQNTEKMSYEDGFFSHVNCQGVIHHTPDAEAAIREIARVLKKNKTAHISVYYKNAFLKVYSKVSFMGKILYKFGVGLKGGNRKSIFFKRDASEIVRLYDGEKNPMGKSYSKEEIVKMVEPYFGVKKVFLNYFPMRVFPFKLAKFLHRFLSKHFGFMIHLNLVKK